MIANREEQWGLSSLKTGSHVYPSSSKLLFQLSVTNRGKTVLSMEPGTGEGDRRMGKEGMQRNAVRLTG